MKTFVVGDNESTMSRVRQELLRQGYECPISNALSFDIATRQLSEFNPDLTVLVISNDPRVAMELMSHVRPGEWGRVIAVGPASDAKLILEAIRKGVDDYVDETDVEAELESTLIRFRENIAASHQQGKIIGCVPSCGGCGSSTLAVNLATALAKKHDRAALVDYRLDSGDLAALMDLKPEYSVADLCDNLPRIDHNMFERMLVKHDCGVHLLASPGSFSEIASVTAQGLREALVMARATFPYVVADFDHPADARLADALCLADILLLIIRLDFASLRNSLRIMQYLKELGIEHDRVRFVANRYGQPREVPSSKAAEALGVRDLFCIPNDPKMVNLANNSGVPVILERPSSRASRSMASLAMSVNGCERMN